MVVKNPDGDSASAFINEVDMRRSTLFLDVHYYRFVCILSPI